MIIVLFITLIIFLLITRKIQVLVDWLPIDGQSHNFLHLPPAIKIQQAAGLALQCISKYTIVSDYLQQKIQWTSSRLKISWWDFYCTKSSIACHCNQAWGLCPVYSICSLPNVASTSTTYSSSCCDLCNLNYSKWFCITYWTLGLCSICDWRHPLHKFALLSLTNGSKPVEIVVYCLK